MGLRKYLVFTFNTGHPYGGMNYFRGSFDSLHEVIAMLRHRPEDQYQVVDRDMVAVVHSGPLASVQALTD